MSSRAKVAVVTGGSSGIGRAVVEALVAREWEVAVLSRTASTAAGWQQPDRVSMHSCDVSRPEEIERTLTAVCEVQGPITGLVNCAGTLEGGDVESVTAEDVQRQFGVNSFGTIFSCRAAMPHLLATQGSIVNISSLLTQRSLADTSVYTATKGAVEAFSRSLAVEVAPHGVRVNVVSPSLVRSNIYLEGGMDAADYEQMLDQWRSEFPLGRVGLPEDVAPVVSFLLSDEASWITGVNIPVDGGRGAA